jgi:integrase
MSEMNYQREKQLADYLNKYVVPQELKIKKIILTTQKNKQGECRVYIELRRYSTLHPEHNKRKRITTEILVTPKNWSAKKQEVLKSDFEYTEKNRAINDLYSKIMNYVNNPSIDYKMAQLSREEFLLIEEVFPTKRLLEYKKSLVNYVEEYVELRKRNSVRNTAKEFTTLLNRVRAFEEHQQKKTYFNDINFTWADAFEEFLIKKYSQGTVEKTFTLLITTLNNYYRKRTELGIEMNDTFREKGFKRGKKSINEANPLTREQLETLYSHTFEEKFLNAIKDRFIWQAYTGLRYCDAFTISKKDIKNGWLWFMPSKTLRHRVRVEQPLNAVALEILEKYDYDMTKLKITNQAYNRSLETMFNKLNEKYPDLKYDPKFGSYASRDTFISLCVEGRVNWHNILKYVGQSSFIIMNRYVKTQDAHKKQEIDKVFQRPKNSN